MNILYGKLGRSVTFNKERWSTIGGDNEAPTLLLNLAKNRPNDKFYLVSNGDFLKLPDGIRNKYPNIIPLMTGYNANYDDHTYLLELIKRKNLKIDYAIIYSGLTSRINIYGLEYLNNKGEIKKAKTLDFARCYVAPIIHVLNELKPRWCFLATDPRFCPPEMRDLTHMPEIIHSQINTTMEFKAVTNWLTLETSSYNIECKYNAIETVFLMNKRRPTFEQYIRPRTDKINIVLNEGADNRGAIMRGPILKEYVLDQFSDDISVYGKWSDEWMSDKRFKGPVRIEELSKLLINTKYTFIIPISYDWATAKFCEMSYFGILPFMHKYYDSQKNISCPDFLRISHPKELKEKIEFLEANENERIRLLTEIYSIYDESYYNGSNVVNRIFERINQ